MKLEFNETNEATYCPEDDKIRLYVGRVPREEYLVLKKQGWTSTPKQDCDFVAVWTPSREQTALDYAGYIGDEDQSPTDRAADRAERFSGYRDKRLVEASNFADTYDNGPIAHGYQNQDRAERAAARHDRIADKACNQWSKAEYWQYRTAGVISNALHKSKPGVRMGRIKKLEAEKRKIEKNYADYTNTRNIWIKISEMEDKEKAFKNAQIFSGYGYDWTKYHHPTRPENDYQKENGQSLYSLLNCEEPITLDQAIELYISAHPEKSAEKERYFQHLELRLSYENQMLEAAGGRAGDIEMKVGGYLGTYQIHKISKSTVTKRIVSVAVLAPKTGYSYQDIPGTEFSFQKMEVERLDPKLYRAPGPGDLEKVRDFQKSLKKDAPKKPALINPTMETAKRIQSAWNEKANSLRYDYDKKDRSVEVSEMTQAQFSARSRGSYSPAGTSYIGQDGNRTYKQYYGNTSEGAVCKIRFMSSSTSSLYQADHVVVITDKPQKDLPAFTPKVVA